MCEAIEKFDFLGSFNFISGWEILTRIFLATEATCHWRIPKCVSKQFQEELLKYIFERDRIVSNHNARLPPEFFFLNFQQLAWKTLLFRSSIHLSICPQRHPHLSMWLLRCPQLSNCSQKLFTYESLVLDAASINCSWFQITPFRCNSI